MALSPVTLTPGGGDSFPVGRVEGLSSTYRTLAIAVREGRVPRPSSPEREFLGLVRNANQGLDPALSLRDLPVEVAQAILDNRFKTMEEFFRSWAESIAKNAAADRQASLKSQEQGQQTRRAEDVRRSVSIFAATLNRARNMQKVSYDDAELLSRTAGIARLADARVRTPTVPIAGNNRWSPMPEPPKNP